ncbi:unnamed protein product [Phaedon cochleariae]|uniref:TAFII-230 TBP-binding domain-containing protein n=1 Tax=Phaedon cochleariae TaxID=80249 RepID=A0A9P0GNS2_PHACE|nr:unnamed protein product [Phaedon cochleariae]
MSDNVSDHAQVLALSAIGNNFGIIGFLFGNIDGEGKYEGDLFTLVEGETLENLKTFGFDLMVKDIFVDDYGNGMIDYMDEDAIEKTGEEQYKKAEDEQNHAGDEMESGEDFHTAELAEHENAQLDEGYDDDDYDANEEEDYDAYEKVLATQQQCFTGIEALMKN